MLNNNSSIAAYQLMASDDRDAFIFCVSPSRSDVESWVPLVKSLGYSPLVMTNEAITWADIENLGEETKQAFLKAGLRKPTPSGTCEGEIEWGDECDT